MYYLLISVIIIILLWAAVGARRGLFRSLFGVIAIIAAFAGTYFAEPYVGRMIVNDTQLDEKIENRIYTKMVSSVEKNIAESLKKQGVGDNLGQLTKEETDYYLKQNMDEPTQQQLIENMHLPDSVKNSMIKNNNDETYSKLGITDFYHYVARYIALQIIQIIAFAITYIVIRAALLLIGVGVNAAVRNIPIVAWVNRAGGFFVGSLVGIATAWLFLTIAEAVFGPEFNSMLGNNIILTKLVQTNIITYVVSNVSKLIGMM